MKTSCLNIKHLYDLPCHFYCKDNNGIYVESNDYHYFNTGGVKGADHIGFSDLDIVTYDMAVALQQNDLHVIKNNLSRVLIEEVKFNDNFNKNDNVAKEFLTISFKQPLYNKRNKIIGILGMSFATTKETAQLPLPSQLLESIQSSLATQLIEAHNITTRQADCLYYLVQGHTAKQIGAILSLSHRTIEHHIDALKNKYQCASRAELIMKALKMDFIQMRLQK